MEAVRSLARLVPSHSVLAQTLWPAKPQFTEEHIPDLHGKVYVVTGSNTGVGKEVARILYSKRANVYIAARSEGKALAAIESIKASTGEGITGGKLSFLRLDLADLSTIKASAEEFLAKESRLDVLFNNAGVMRPPAGATTAQGYELQLGVNNIGTFMFTKLLTPAMVQTAKTEPKGSVRVVWVASSAAEFLTSVKGGVPVDELDGYPHESRFWMHTYGISKAGNYLHATEFAKRHRADGVVSVALNPGNLDSDLWRDWNPAIKFFLQTTLFYPPLYGAYTELFAGLSEDVTVEKSGSWIVPWGRFMDIRVDLQDASRTKDEGGTGVAERFWGWTEKQVKPFL